MYFGNFIWVITRLIVAHVTTYCGIRRSAVEIRAASFKHLLRARIKGMRDVTQRDDRPTWPCRSAVICVVAFRHPTAATG